MSKSSKKDAQQFIIEVADIIEADPRSLSLKSDFREAADFWSSLVGFALLTFMEDRYGTTLSVEEFIECQTVDDLYAKIGIGSEILAIISEVLGRAVPEDGSMDTVAGWDSLKTLQIVMALDEAGYEVPLEKIAEIKSVRDILSFTNKEG